MGTGNTERRYTTRFGSLSDYETGRVELINDDPRHYAFSNMFSVAATSKPYEKVAVGKNMKYVLEAIRAEGTSPWYTAAHDQSALVMDGEVEITLMKIGQSPLGPDAEGAVTLEADPSGTRMGRVVARRGHLTLLPAWSAYRFHAEHPSVILQQTIAGPETLFRWSEISQIL